MDDRLPSLLDSLDIPLDRVIPVGGGDINDSYHLKVSGGGDLFAKINKRGRSASIITTEYQGLEMMRKAGVEMIPDDIRLAESGTDACLVMPYYETTWNLGSTEWERFFENLAHMHSITNEVFGGADNFIGLLPQINNVRNNWVPFFRENRLQPQFRQAMDSGYFTLEDESRMIVLLDNLSNHLPIERPALIHGDLWSGNILLAINGIRLIDPCPYYGHREMDFAMMALFSGVPLRQYLPVYEDIFPLASEIYDRIELYQLYYLLVHLNMFGVSYLPGVRRIIKKFSG